MQLCDRNNCRKVRVKKLRAPKQSVRAAYLKESLAYLNMISESRSAAAAAQPSGMKRQLFSG